MKAPRTLVWLLVLATLLAACGAGDAPRGADPTPTVRVALVPATPTAPANEPTPPPAASATAEATSAPVEPTTRSEAPAEETFSPEPPGPGHDIPEDFRPSPQAQKFARRVQSAVFALEELPGYEYVVSDPLSAPGLTLTGRVASPREREWIVTEQGAPEHVVARWVVMGGKAYTDYNGTWEEIQRVPFDPNSPLSFGGGYRDALFEPFGPDGEATAASSRVRVGERAATRYDLERDLSEQFGEPPPPEIGTTSTDSAWIAEDGGYLLRYEGGGVFGGPGPQGRSVEVTPLATAPRIDAPAVGEPVFSGDPPPWRAAVLAQERLDALRSYRYESAMGAGPAGTTTSGRVSDDRGALRGTVLDMNAMTGRPPSGAEDPATVEVAMVYIGPKAWARVGDQPWRRVPTGVASGYGAGGAEANAFQLAFSVPSGPPRALLGDEAGLLDSVSTGVFGLNPGYGGQPVTRGTLVGTETVNGVRALRYKGTIQAPELAGGPLTTDLWLAADGWYLVRARTSGPAEAFTFYPATSEYSVGGGARRIDIFDANVPVEVEPPAP